MIGYNSNNKHLARNNRKNPTEAEKLVWSKIRRKQLKGYQFYRQKPIGEYIVDFYCPAACLVIEIDGGGHFTPDQQQKDVTREKFLSESRLHVIRFSNTDVMTNIEGVIQKVFDMLT